MTPTIAPLRHASTKIVATLGPASNTPEMLERLARAGVDVFRLNTAHGALEEHDRVFNLVRTTSERLRRHLAVLVDLSGPKIRLGKLAEDPLHCAPDARLDFVRGDVSASPTQLTSNYPQLVDELAVGDAVLLADGTVSLTVESKSATAATCRVVQPGMIRTRQGINLPGASLSLPAMTESDHRFAEWAAKRGADFISLSFVRKAEDVWLLRGVLKRAGATARLIAKIEKPEALAQLEEIVEAADGLMVARGDLGVETDVARVPIAQKEIIAACHRHQKPVITATQMLDSMQRSRYPTRAEASDVANAILDGTDACMLSGETAVGEYPIESVEMMNRIAMATEELRQRPPMVGEVHQVAGLQPVTQAVVVAACDMARSLDAKLMVVASRTGATATALSKQRTFVPALGVSESATTLRQMCLAWGVVPLWGTGPAGPEELLWRSIEWGSQEGILSSGDRVVLLTSNPLAPHGHNMVIVHTLP